ncbi:MAG: S8 family serine peptidase [Candidatus Promineofilum sp.]|nr:S8 family serine peptidase [Promineifilum sp.]
MIKNFFAVILLVVVVAGRAAPSGAYEPAGSSWDAVTVPAGLNLTTVAAGSDRATDNPKLDNALADLARSPDRQATEAAEVRLEAGRVQIQIVVHPDNETAAREHIAALGGEITGSFEGTIQAWLPIDQLTDLSAAPAIDYIQQPNTVVLADAEAVAALTEGRAAANADVWHDAGWQGQSVRVAIIDGGFQNYQTKLGSDLPLSVTVKNFVDGQSDAEVDEFGGAHGTACAEIVHDMAPQAQLYLLKISTDIDLNEAVDYAISQGVDIISTSLTFVNATPGDGSGRFAVMAQKARAAGILWTTAAGNYRETHWSGAFIDSDGDGFHEYAPGVEVNVFGLGNGTAFLIPAGVALSPSIRWNDWTTVKQNYRLVLLRHNGSAYSIVATSDNPQTGQLGQRPTERISYYTSGAAAVYGVAIQRISSDRSVYLHLLTPNRELDRRTPSMSLGSLADVATVLTVAAVDVDVPFVREEYSSEGPTNGPGGAPTGGFLKPDIAAFANVSTASYGPRGFNGTSAATPHVAGAAALVRSAFPSALPGEVQDYLQTRAVNQGTPGADPQFGYGRLRLDAPPQPLVLDHHAYVAFVTATP